MPFYPMSPDNDAIRALRDQAIEAGNLTKSVVSLTKLIVWLTLVNVILTGVNVVVALVR